MESLMFGVLMTILLRKKVTRKYLAEKFEVSQRTISRYIDKLCEAGVPIYSTKGVAGGYSISAEYQFERNFFTKEELSRLITCLRSSDTPNDIITKSLIDKITFGTKKGDKSQYFFNMDSIIIDSVPWNNTSSYRAKSPHFSKRLPIKQALNFPMLTAMKLALADFSTRIKSCLKKVFGTFTVGAISAVIFVFLNSRALLRYTRLPRSLKFATTTFMKNYKAISTTWN